MLAVASSLIVVVVSILVTRIATAALEATGLPHDVAAFQARSALTNAGFTTSEAESVVDHPVRRRIVAILLLVGSAGLATVVASLVISFVSATRSEAATRFFVLVAGLLIILVLVRSKPVTRVISRVIDAALRRWTDLDTRDLVSLLGLTGEYEVSEFEVKPKDWLAAKNLEQTRLYDEGITVLAIRRGDGQFIGAPRASTIVYPYDKVVVYGRAEDLERLSKRPAGPSGDGDHRAQVGAERRRREEQTAATSPVSSGCCGGSVADAWAARGADRAAGCTRRWVCGCVAADRAA